MDPWKHCDHNTLGRSLKSAARIARTRCRLHAMAGRPLEIRDEEEVNGRYAICNAELSRIVSFDSVHRSVNDRTPYTLLRPIVIDGPLVGVGYDQEYSLDDRIISCKNYIRRPKPLRGDRHGFEKMSPYPLSALVKILFYFIARGHKVTAFLPLFFNDRLEDACSSSATMVTDVKQFRELVRLKLIKFLPGENFANHLKHRTAKCQGILVTTQDAFYSDNAIFNRNTCSARGSELERATIGTEEASCDLMYSTQIPEMSLGKSKLPVIIPLWRPYNLRLIISLDVIRWKKILEVKASEVSVSQYNKLLNEEQLTLRVQSEFLEILAAMMDGEFPCGPQDAKIAPLVRQAWGRIDKAESFAQKKNFRTNGEKERKLESEAKFVETLNLNRRLDSSGTDVNLRNTVIGYGLSLF